MRTRQINRKFCSLFFLYFQWLFFFYMYMHYMTARTTAIAYARPCIHWFTVATIQFRPSKSLSPSFSISLSIASSCSLYSSLHCLFVHINNIYHTAYSIHIHIYVSMYIHYTLFFRIFHNKNYSSWKLKNMAQSKGHKNIRIVSNYMKMFVCTKFFSI